MTHNKLLIATVDIITEPLTIIFNRCLNEGIFPNICNIAHVTPLHEKGSENLCNNYRPISLLSCVGKFLERCVHSRVLNYLNVNNIIAPSQSGFMPGDSTVNLLTSICNDLCTSFDQGITTQSIFSPRHFQSLRSSVAQGISGKNRSSWYKRQFDIMVSKLFTNRKQAVVIKDTTSEHKTIPSGVPQLLGYPLLFLIYIYTT